MATSDFPDSTTALGAVLHHVMDAVGFALLVISADEVQIAEADRAGLLLLAGEHADDGGPAKQAILEGQPVMIADLRQQGSWPTIAEHATAQGWQAAAAWPLELHDAEGALAVVFDRPIHELSTQVIAGPDIAVLAAAVLSTDRELGEARAQIGHLGRALDTRIVIEQAKGILSVQLSLTPAEAFDHLRVYARNNRHPIHDVARGVIDGTVLIR